MSYVIVEASDRDFRKLSDTFIMKLLRYEQDSYRKSVALKCVIALQKQRVTKILSNYTSESARYYYNVVHWLDLGASAPSDRAKAAARNVMDTIWQG